MNLHRKIANEGYEDTASCTTRTRSHHGLGRALRRIKRVRNRAAKRREARLDFASQ